MVREIILAGRKPGCSQHAPSKPSDRWEGGFKRPPSDSSVYWRARQHPSRAPESRQAGSGDIPITLPINNEAFQQLSRPSHSSCRLCWPCRGRRHSTTISHFMARQKNWGREATTESQFAWVMLHWHLGFEPPSLPIWYLLCSSAVGRRLLPAALIRIHLDLRWNRRR